MKRVLNCCSGSIRSGRPPDGQPGSHLVCFCVRVVTTPRVKSMDPSLHLAFFLLDCVHMAQANGTSVCALPSCAPGGAALPILSAASAVLCLSCATVEDGLMLLAGCADGSLLAARADWWLRGGCLRIPLLQSPLRELSVAPRANATDGGGWLAALHADGAIVALRISEVAGALERVERSVPSGPMSVLAASLAVVPFVRVSLVGARSPCAATAALLPLRSPLFEPTWDASARCAGGFTLAASGGAAAAPLGLYHVDIDSGSSRSLGELASNAAAALGGAVTGLARDLVGAALPVALSSGLWRLGGGILAMGGGGGAQASRQSKGASVEQDAAARLTTLRSAHARPATCDFELPVGGHALVALLRDPAGSMLLARDNVGRVLLLDGTDLTVLRLWKGYRDCQYAWLTPGLPSALPGARPDETLGECAPPPALILLYSPRRGQVEAWPAGPIGDRIANLRLPREDGVYLTLLPVSHAARQGGAGALLLTRSCGGRGTAAAVEGTQSEPEDALASEVAEGDLRRGGEEAAVDADGAAVVDAAGSSAPPGNPSSTAKGSEASSRGFEGHAWEVPGRRAVLCVQEITLRVSSEVATLSLSSPKRGGKLK